MSTAKNPDSQFQLYIQHFAKSFGIEEPENVLTETREVLAGSVRIDTMILFPKAFDFSSLKDKILPFWGVFNIGEYKGPLDPLKVGHVYQYALTELGLITTRLLSRGRKDRSEREWLSQKQAKAQWRALKERGALHSCCTVIFSTTDPIGIRKESEFEPVTDYPHLEGALHRWVVADNPLVGSIAVYLIVINRLIICPKNAPLLLLATGRQLTNFCRWLLEDAEGITIEEKQEFLTYLVTANLIENEEVAKAMKFQLFGSPQYDWIFEGVAEKPKDYQEGFYQTALEKMMITTSAEQIAQKALGATSSQELAQKALGATSSQELAQKALGATSSQELAQKALGVTSSQELAQKALGASSPFEAALKLVKSEEERRQLIALLLQENQQHTAEE